MNAATALKEVSTNFEPHILDSHGDKVIPKRGLMVKLDSKANEKVELSKGTIWLLGAFVVILNLAFNYGGSFISSARESESQKMEIQQLQNDVKTIREDQKAGFAAVGEDIKDIKKTMQAIEVKKSFELGAQQGR
jgi:hypothetical protein